MFIHKYREKKRKYFCLFRIMLYLCSANDNGAIAQMVEQRTENPCVPGSIPGGTTIHFRPIPGGTTIHFRLSSEVDFLLSGISLLVVARHNG